ncbi:MAG: hypothetical protein JXJ22_10665 [Bacteroidales bacterium]|nr:hypothetical protein [Bacteroidales bacterium]
MIRIKLLYTVLICLSAWPAIALNAQEDINHDVIFRAMHDELERNMKELVYKDYDKPFFISYTVADMYELHINASLGAIISAADTKHKTWSARVMVGDYKLNDENYSANVALPEQDIPEYDFPMDSDYQGIRRALWVITNNIYKKAATGYDNKIKTLERNNLSPDDLEIDDFWKVPVITTIVENPIQIPDIKILEEFVKNLSVDFNSFAEIVESNVTLDGIFATVYFMNSEGIQIKIPLQISNLSINAGIYSTSGEVINQSINYLSDFPENFPAGSALHEDLLLLVKNLSDTKNAEHFNENYSGPVLVEGQSGLELVFNQLFNVTNTLMAYREPLVNGNQQSMYYGEKLNLFETKLNKRVITDNLSIITYPDKTTGDPTIGKFRVDAEGVIPADSLILIENGVLKSLLNGRTPTRMINESNGYNRFSIFNGYISKNLAPGILSILSNELKSLDELKKMLLQKAKEEALDYAIIIRPLKKSENQFPVNIYKADLKSGKETLIQSAFIKSIPENVLRKSVFSSNRQMSYNLMLNGNQTSVQAGNSVNYFTGGVPVTVTGPDAFLFNEIEIGHTLKPLSGRLPIVGNPVGEQKNP